MLNRQVTSDVACCFLVTYYRDFVQETHVLALADLYAENSQLIYAEYNEESPLVLQGKQSISMHIVRQGTALGRRKVEVRFVDYASLPNGCIHIVCQGLLYLRGQRRSFFQAFVLAPTPHRSNTFHIASDYMRIVHVDVEEIPEGSVIVSSVQIAQEMMEEQERRVQMERLRKRAKQEAAEEARRREQQQQLLLFQQQIQMQNQQSKSQQPALQRRERPPRSAPRRAEVTDGLEHTPNGTSARAENGRGRPREERIAANGAESQNGKRRERRDRRERGDKTHDENAARNPTSTTLTTAAAVGDEYCAKASPHRPVPRSKQERRKPETTPNPEAENHTDRKNPPNATQRSNRSRPSGGRGAKTGSTDYVRLVRVPKTIKLSDIKEAVGAASGVEPLDAYWFGHARADCVLQLPSAAAAERMVRESLTVLDTPLTTAAFYP